MNLLKLSKSIDLHWPLIESREKHYGIWEFLRLSGIVQILLSILSSHFIDLGCSQSRIIHKPFGQIFQRHGGRILKRQISSVLIFLLFFLTLTNCSWLTNRKSLFGDDEPDVPENSSSSLQTVPKAQYDQLAKRYEEVIAENRSLKGGGNIPMNAPVANQNNYSRGLINELKGSHQKNQGELVETVDVFANDGGQNPGGSTAPVAPTAPMMKSAAMPPAIISNDLLDQGMVDDHIAKLNKAKLFIQQNRFDAALKELKEIERSPVRQIRVRTKFHLAEILFLQSEFDLAMQIYEEIIRDDAFSGIVLKTLGRLIVCSEKLNLNKKKEMYYSMFYDIFDNG